MKAAVAKATQPTVYRSWSTPIESLSLFTKNSTDRCRESDPSSSSSNSWKKGFRLCIFIYLFRFEQENKHKNDTVKPVNK